MTFFSNSKQKNDVNLTCFNAMIALEILLITILVRYMIVPYIFQVIWIPIGTNCEPLTTDLFLCCYEFHCMTKISKDPSKQHLIQKFINTFKNLITLFDILMTMPVCSLKLFILLKWQYIKLILIINTALSWTMIFISLTGILILKLTIKELIFHCLL